MKRKARYICLEGTEGLGKTTQTQKLVDHLKAKGFKVLQTKEPGTPLMPVTMELRNLMLNNAYDESLTVKAREYISQAIRSIHLEKLVFPALDEYDFIIQDRGILSGLAYGKACGNDLTFLERLSEKITLNAPRGIHYLCDLYDDVILLEGSISKGLDAALNSKQEFEEGDAMESRGISFLEEVSFNMKRSSERFNTSVVDITGKNVDEVFEEILNKLKLG